MEVDSIFQHEMTAPKPGITRRTTSAEVLSDCQQVISAIYIGEKYLAEGYLAKEDRNSQDLRLAKNQLRNAKTSDNMAEWNAFRYHFNWASRLFAVVAIAKNVSQEFYVDRVRLNKVLKEGQREWVASIFNFSTDFCPPTRDIKDLYESQEDVLVYFFKIVLSQIANEFDLRDQALFKGKVLYRCTIGLYKSLFNSGKNEYATIFPQKDKLKRRKKGREFVFGNLNDVCGGIVRGCGDHEDVARGRHGPCGEGVPYACCVHAKNALYQGGCIRSDVWQFFCDMGNTTSPSARRPMRGTIPTGVEGIPARPRERAMGIGTPSTPQQDPNTCVAMPPMQLEASMFPPSPAQLPALPQPITPMHQPVQQIEPREVNDFDRPIQKAQRQMKYTELQQQRLSPIQRASGWPHVQGLVVAKKCFADSIALMRQAQQLFHLGMAMSHPHMPAGGFDPNAFATDPNASFYRQQAPVQRQDVSMCAPMSNSYPSQPARSVLENYQQSSRNGIGCGVPQQRETFHMSPSQNYGGYPFGSGQMSSAGFQYEGFVGNSDPNQYGSNEMEVDDVNAWGASTFN